MLEEKVSAVVFEGGAAHSPIEEDMAAVRKAVVLDNLEKLGRTEGIDQIILCTNYPDLADSARALGAVVDLSDSAFHFGRRLLEVIARYGLTNVFYMGGPAAPLIRSRDLDWVATRLREEKNIVILNNVQSPDIVRLRLCLIFFGNDDKFTRYAFHFFFYTSKCIGC